MSAAETPNRKARDSSDRRGQFEDGARPSGALPNRTSTNETHRTPVPPASALNAVTARAAPPDADGQGVSKYTLLRYNRALPGLSSGRTFPGIETNYQK